jgi:hypothetical protein
MGVKHMAAFERACAPVKVLGSPCRPTHQRQAMTVGERQRMPAGRSSAVPIRSRGWTRPTSQGRDRRVPFGRLRIAFGLAFIAALVISIGCRPAWATPVFAQAYGLSCTACHTQMPVLNAFGRYIQRTGYAAMNRKTLEHAVPAFVFDLGTGYTQRSGQPARLDRITGPGNTTVFQANGFLGPDETYKVEQLLAAGGRGGVLDQVWVAYHNFLDHHGHLFVGKLAEINLDEFSAFVLGDVNDAGQGSVPDVAVGVHDYALDYDGGRWGTKFDYVAGKTDAEIAYFANATGGNSFGDWYDFSKAADTSVQWKLAYADPAKPYELGVFGESGALGFTGSGLVPGLHVDRYAVVAPYIQKDPRPGSPGFRFEYAMATDSNPGFVTLSDASAALRPVGSTSSSWMIGSISQMVLHDHGMLNLTYYHTNDAIGELGFTGLIQRVGPTTGAGPGFSYAVNPYTRIYAAFSVAQNQRPTIALKMWLTPPLWNRLK